MRKNKEDKIKFVLKYRYEIRKYGVTRINAEIARKELGYSDKTYHQDIAHTIERTWKRTWRELST